MSTFRKFNKKCAICGNESEYDTIMSTNSFGSPDLDLRPPQMRRSTMWLWVQKCPECGYVNYTVDSRLNITRELLESIEYIDSDGMNFKSELADDFYKHYMLLSRCRNYMEAYNALLYCAWACDDANDIATASSIRKKMVKLYEKIPAYKRENENIIAQYVDVLRRSSQFDVILEHFADFKASDEVIQKVIGFQIALAKKEDTGVYTVRDALES